MSETIALARLLFARSRTQLILAIAWTLISILFGLVAGALFDEWYLPFGLFISTFPVMLWSLGVFEFGNNESLSRGESGYSHWLLRMPISDSKLAFVPLAMRFVWITLFYSTLVLVAGLAAGVWLPVVTGLILFWSGGAWTSAIGWRPFRGMWRRIGAVVLAGGIYYVLAVFVMSVHFDGNTDINFLRRHPLWAKIVVLATTCVALGAGIWLSFSSLRLARTNSLGLVPENDSKLTGWVGRLNALLAPDASQPIVHRNGRAALMWHDTRRSLLQSQHWAMFFTIAAMVIGIAFLPLHVGNAIFLMFLMTQLGVMSGSPILEQTKLSGCNFPPYIAASPLTCAEIGFTRGLTGISVAYIGTVIFGLAYIVGLLMPYNQRILTQWIGHVGTVYENPNAAYRWMAVIFIAVVACVPSRSLAFTWPTMTGRSRVSIIALTLPVLVMLTSVGIVCAWFLKQARGTWETTIANAWYWAAWIPTLLAVLLVIKFAGTAVAVAMTLSKKLIQPQTAAAIAAIWLVVTLALAGVAQTLIPDDRILFRWTLMVTALMLPLGRVLVLPYAVYLNRYR